MQARYICCRRVSVRPSVRPSVTSRYGIEAAGRIRRIYLSCNKTIAITTSFLACRLPSSYHTLYYKKIWVSPKIRVLPSGTLFQTPYLENFATASRSRCQLNSSSSSSSTVELVDATYATTDESWLFTTSRSTVTISLRITAIYCGFVVQLVPTGDKISTDIARRAVRLR